MNFPGEPFGRYRLLERLGEGGMAEVFKAKSFGVEGFEKVLVIKRILPKLAAQPRFVDMFVHEAKLAVRLSHANIVQVFDLGRLDLPSGDPTSYFIAMEYVPGLDLASVLQRCRRMKRKVPVGMAVFIAAEVAKALDHAHRRRDEQSRPLGIVHRDISPQNILVSWEGEVKVTDFGIAKATQSMTDEEVGPTRVGRVRGKLAYMSPEQSRAEAIDGRSDLFSLGTVLYEMLAGSNPFAAPTAFEVARRLQASEFPPLTLSRPDAPPQLVEILGKVLARHAGERFADAGRLHEALLGYFYATGERFGAGDLASFLEPFREPTAGGGLEHGEVFAVEPAGANERTPVEGAQPSGARSRTGSGAMQLLDRGDAALSQAVGERREVTALVLHVDTRDEGAAQKVLTRAEEVLARYGAMVIEREEGHVAALFGLEEADARDTEAAVRAGFVILRAGRRALVSAGIHLGRILVGPTGMPVRDERLTSLITAAQALARAGEGQVAISAAASRVIRGAFMTDALPGAGSSAPEGGRMVAASHPPASLYGRFVGRREELRLLGDILAAATRRRPQIVVIQGEKGVGKTRLLSEMERRLSLGNYDVGYYRAPCPRNGTDAPWSGLTAMLQVLCGIQEGDDEDRILALLPRLRALGLRDEEAAAVLGQLGAELGDPVPSSPGNDAALRTAFARMVQSLCEDRLHCFAWDEAQGMDPQTLEAILSTAGRASMRAVFLLATRGDAPPVLAGHPYFHRIHLRELSEEDAVKLLAARIDAKVLPPELVDFCRQRAGGHPLFVEELLRELSDSGALSVRGGVVKARLEGAFAIPRSLRTLILARMRRMDAEERAVLQAAAILGDPVFIEVLAVLLQKRLPAVSRVIAGLVERDLLRSAGPAQASFASPIHGEIVLDSLPAEARRDLHAAAAAAYVTVIGEHGVEHAERVGEHLYQAGDRDRAATFFARAALHKARAHQVEPALRLIYRALDLADHEQRSADELSAWLGVLAGALGRVRVAPDLSDLLARALRRIDAVGSVEIRILARLDAARAMGAVNLFEAAYAELEEVSALVGDREELRRRALLCEIHMATRSGDFNRGARVVERLEALGTAQDPEVLMAISDVRAAFGDSTSALAALDRAEALSDPRDLAAACERAKHRVLIYAYSRNIEASLEASSKAVDLARATGIRYEIAAALHNLGDGARRLGDLQRAYASLTESKEIAEALGNERLLSLNRVHLAYLDGLSGVPGADDLLRDLIRYADARGYWTDALEGRFLLGALLLRRGTGDEARRELEETQRMAESYGYRLIAEDAREALGQIPV
ncbi:serine/threonine-protein kinase [Chondromyces apiculatus]|uniref:Serine/threonine protein kinase PrkC, regulator of stationary phase n=1 Tax=Chondromyces apiculatus DSM 436 TaxID=1192034 RepID=A0A017T9J8_9BACT|nr:serine/threonine-protein kinase [Chondromyces apiculatus]EYF05582.1 Serine/threonine protein kinase PrkC, regulator of stationary phase [Chondromyces apiculatus DSM 436]